MRYFTIGMATALGLSLAGGAAKADANAAMLSFVQDNVMAMFENPAIVAAVTARNAETAGLTADEILALDADWRAEIGSASQPLISSVLTSPESAMLSEQVAASGGYITELFVMDARGLNVASSAVTSDYWQGDEAKFQKTYEVGPNAFEIGEIELDESTSQYQGQVSFTLKDPATGEPIGAVTVGLNATNFF